MSINQLDSKKQFLILVVMAVVLLGLYAQFRVLPELDQLARLDKQLQKDQKLLKRPKIPEEPIEEIESLNDDIAQLEEDVDKLHEESLTLAKNLPTADNQDLMVRISDAARVSRVRIVKNVPYLTKKRINIATPSVNKKLSRKEQRKQEKQIRKAMKNARKAAKRNQVVGQFTRQGELMDKLVNDFAVSRPLHQLQIEGSYHHVRAFIEALESLPWQVTVVKIDYKLLGRGATQGYPQPLAVNMIIGA